MSISEQGRLVQASSASTNLPMRSVLPALHRGLVLVWDELPVGKKVWISQGFTLGRTITIIPPAFVVRRIDTCKTCFGQIGGKHLITTHSQVDGHRSIFSNVKKLIQFNGEGGKGDGGTKHRGLLQVNNLQLYKFFFVQVNQNKKQFNRPSSFSCVSTSAFFSSNICDNFCFLDGTPSSGTYVPLSIILGRN